MEQIYPDKSTLNEARLSALYWLLTKIMTQVQTFALQSHYIRNLDLLRFSFGVQHNYPIWNNSRENNSIYEWSSMAARKTQFPTETLKPW